MTFSAIFLAIIFPNIFFSFFSFSLSLVLTFHFNNNFEERDQGRIVVKILKKITKYPNYFHDIIAIECSMLQFFKYAKIGWKGIWFIEVERERERERAMRFDRSRGVKMPRPWPRCDQNGGQAWSLILCSSHFLFYAIPVPRALSNA